MRLPALSACLVVKNEELFLEEGLRSLRDVAGEIVVVDTGSVDRTLEIARRWADKVVEEPWPGDLGRAHDLPVAHATGDWVLSLDGDEVLDPSAPDVLPAALARTETEGFVLPVRNYTYGPQLRLRLSDPTDPLTHGASCWTPSRNVRLFRRNPAYRHVGRLHQSPLQPILAAGGEVGELDVTVHHYGFLRTDRGKSAFYVKLAAAEVADRPGDPKALLELGHAQETAGELDLAEVSYREAVTHGSVAEGRFFLAKLAAARHDWATALAEARAALAALPRETLSFAEEADLRAVLADVLAETGDGAGALAELRGALGLRPGDPFLQQRLAVLLFLEGEMEEGWRHARAALATVPAAVQCRVAAGIGHLQAGALDDAIRELEIALDITSLNPLAHYNLAIAQARGGAEAAAHVSLRRAVAADLDERLAPEVRARYVAPAVETRPRRLGPEGVATVIPDLAGGGAMAAVEVCEALGPGRPQAVITASAGEATGEQHHRLLERLGIPIWQVSSRDALLSAIATAAPGAVINHWWGSTVFQALERVGEEILILNGTGPSPVPAGYDLYVTLSEFQAQYQDHIPAERQRRIPNGIDLDAYRGAAPDLRYWPQRAARRVAVLSRLDPDKFTARLADHLEALRGADVEVVVAGRGPRRWEAEPQLAARGLSDLVRFVGPIPQTAVPGFLAAADIGLHLTETHQESHSFTILQMMASGLPLVAQPRGFLPEVIDDGVTGCLATDPAEIGARLRALVLDPDLCRSMGGRARERVAEFSLERFRARWRELVEGVLA